MSESHLPGWSVLRVSREVAVDKGWTHLSLDKDQSFPLKPFKRLL